VDEPRSRTRRIRPGRRARPAEARARRRRPLRPRHRKGGGAAQHPRAARDPFDGDLICREGRHRGSRSPRGRSAPRCAGLLGGSPANLPGASSRLGAGLATGLQLHLATARHHPLARRSRLARARLLRRRPGRTEPRALPRTRSRRNGVAGTMRRVAAAAAESLHWLGRRRADAALEPGTLPSHRTGRCRPLVRGDRFRFPLPTDVLQRVEAERPDVVHVATPGPVGFAASRRAAARDPARRPTHRGRSLRPT
jgi:hypothetical protein